MSTRWGDSQGQSVVLDNQTVPNPKLALPLWIKLQQSPEGQYFDVLITLDTDPGASQLQALKRAGLVISNFHQQQPSRLMPGVITRKNLLEQLPKLAFVEYIEGVFHHQKNY